MHRIALINGFFSEYTTASYFWEAAQRNGVECKTFRPEQQAAIGSHFDRRLFIDDGTHYVIRPHSSSLKVLYIIDTHTDFELDTFLIRFADYVFCAQRNAVEEISHFCPKVTWLPLACDPIIHYCMAPPNSYDVAFIGGINDEKRKRYLTVLQERFGSRAFIGKAQRTEIGKVYSGSRIVFNVSANNDINMRFFEALCSGALLVTERIIGNGMEELLSNEKEPVCVFYNSIDEAMSLIDYYLQHEAERKEIAQRGRAFSLKHTYSTRFETILALTEGTEIRRHQLFGYARAKTELARAEQTAEKYKGLG